MPIIESKGAASSQGFGEFAKTGTAVYIEDVFNNYIYNGNGTSQAIPANIDLSTYGGMVWVKVRSFSANHGIWDTARGFGTGYLSTQNKVLSPNTNSAEGGGTMFDWLSSPSTTGFTVNTNTAYPTSRRITNANTANFDAWTFRKQAKFFDIVTYTGNATNSRTISHNLGSTPGCILVKSVSAAGSWWVWHRAFNSGNGYGQLDSTSTFGSAGGYLWGDGTTYAAPTSTNFTISAAAEVNSSGVTYVAYIFAHNAGGFGLNGTDNVISCGSFATNSSGKATVTLGYEPQWVLMKSTDTAQNWYINDVMRGMPGSAGYAQSLYPNATSAESSAFVNNPAATGFTVEQQNANTNWIYIAIRRGPMKVPTDATQVFSPNAVNVAQGTQISTNFPVDMTMATYRSGGGTALEDRLRGISTAPTDSTTETYFLTYSTAGDANSIGFTYGWNNTGFLMNAGYANANDIFWSFRRAPKFFDEVCYTGTGSATTFNHNLAATPELMIVKDRSASTNWFVYSATLGATKYLNLNQTSASATATAPWNDTAPTSSVFTVGTSGSTNSAADAYAAYLFATCPGVSKVGSYTGNGSTQTIDCGFTGGARFVLIKRTDSTGDWYVYDTARGMTTLTDPYLLLNSTAAESATLGSVTTVTTGFAVNASVLAAINTNAASYIYLAIA